MSTTLQSSELLGVIEEALVRHRVFGDSAYIQEQFQFCSKRRLGVIAESLPSAGRLLEALQGADPESVHRVTGNTVIRCAIQHAHVQVSGDIRYGLPLADCEAIFDATTRHVLMKKPGTPLENGSFPLPRLGSEPHHGWIWSEQYPDDLFGRSFRFLVKQNYDASLNTPAVGTPTEHDIEILVQAERLLQTLLPLLTRSALSHAHLIGVFPNSGAWKGKASSSQIKIGGTIFLGRCLLTSPWIAAEHMLHEALHQKLYDFRHGHNLLDPDYAKRGAPRVCSPWNPEAFNQGNHWDSHRAFAAFHVYVQLCLMSRIAKERARELEKVFGPADGMIDSRKAFERAWYLGEQLRSAVWDQLGFAGQQMVNWLQSVLEALEPSPPPRNAYFHLVLDLYQTEAKKVDSTLANSAPEHSVLRGKLATLAKQEVESARGILSAIQASPQLVQLDEALRQFSEDELGARFSRVRAVVARTLFAASPDGYGLKAIPIESGDDPNELVRQMVLNASQRLHMTLENVPDAVAAARRRAHRERFTISSEERVGRLLAVLSAAVPQGGRILEIGTGTGVGTAWLTTGLHRRTDVEVVTVEVEPRLSEAAKEWPWPDYVRILTADVLDVLPELGAFNLIFVDAAPIKRHIEPTIGSLCPGGILVVDDMRIDSRMTEEQVTRVGDLRSVLLHHPRLQALELEWAAGVVIAAAVEP